MRHASFTLDYEVHSGPLETDPVAATAETMLVPYDTASGRPRRLTEDGAGLPRRQYRSEE